MSAQVPQDLHTLFVELANAGDLDGLVALYESDAAYVSPQGAQVVGSEAIRELLGQLLSVRPVFENATNHVIVTGEIALLSNTWRAVVEAPEGDPVELTGTSTEVARRQPDGTWLYIIDAPASVV
jgi:uncharacterized protein (TIGR02246 family)